MRPGHADALLTALLREPLAAAQGRVITTSSRAGAARGARVVPGDLDMANGYDGLRAYQASKLANVLFTRELARRWGPLKNPRWQRISGSSAIHILLVEQRDLALA